MMRFDKYTLQSLEYPRIKEEVAKQCYCQGGKQIVNQLAPHADIAIVEENLLETKEMKEILAFEEPFPMEMTEKVDLLIAKLKVEGSILDAEQLKRLSDFQKIITALAQYRKNKESKYPRLVSYLRRLEPLEELILRIERAIDQAGEIKDSASDKLRRIRGDKTIARARILTRLNQILGHRAQRPDRQEEVITLREGRYVITIPDSEFDRASHVVHDRSRSGATLYVEPTAAIELNNRLKELHLEEQHEIERILQELSDFARARVDKLESNYSLYCRLDFLQAKARFCQGIDADLPVLRSEPVISLKAAYHPLLLLAAKTRSEVVPLDLDLGYRHNIIVITGPNTGGKTVAIKTVGLSVLMLQSGLLIPADAKSEVGIFAKVFADIGDEQSIELSLSTFSSHISRITAALEHCERGSLLLFDEIGAGTDPKEGAALGEAILQYVSESDAKCVVTTHYSALKVLAESNPKVENAAFEFDRQTLRPTFRLRTGLPGSSYAIEIASRLGMPEKVIKKAGELVGSQERSLADLIARLEEQLVRAESERKELEGKLKQAGELEKYWRAEKEKVDKKEKELLTNGLTQAQELVDSTRKQLNQLIKELKEEQVSSAAVKKSRKSIEDLRRELEEKTSLLQPPPQGGDPPEAGDRVWVEKFQTAGELLEKHPDGKKGKVRIGNVLYTMELSRLRKLTESEKPPPLPAGVNYQPYSDDLSMEVSIRGLTVEEARECLDKYFDQISISNIHMVRIVHGKGTGALRRFVREYLSKNKLVESFDLGEWNEGGSGVTVVKLKQ